MKRRHLVCHTAVLSMVALFMGATAQAADISMTGDDGFGTSSLNSAGKWSDGLAPAAGNHYFNANYMLRTPTDGNSYVFGGDSLTITSDLAAAADLNDTLMFKGTASATITVNNLTIDGGSLRHANNENQTFTLAGNGLTVGASGMGVHAQGPIVVTAPVFGSGEIKIVNNGSDNAARVLHFASAANTYTGSMNLETANRSRFALDSGADLDFVIGASGTNNKIYGVGVATFDGIFSLDLTGASTTMGDTWLLVDASTLTETFGSTFSVAGFHDNGDNTWSAEANGAWYRFKESTGALTVVPEPASLMLLALASLLVSRRRVA